MTVNSDPNARLVTVEVGRDLFRLPQGDALRLARAIRNLVKSELAAINAANTEASTHDTDNIRN